MGPRHVYGLGKHSDPFRLDDEHDAYAQWATRVGRDNLKAYPDNALR